jgi:hypothetical protein
MHIPPFRFKGGLPKQHPPRFLLLSAQFFIEEIMKFLMFIANAFINTMGITQPSPQAANRAAWFIVIMLTTVLAMVATIAFVAIHWASHP